MPLKYGASNATRGENIGREVAAGKPKAQAAAIAYDIQRRSRRKKRKKHGSP
jgi:hypothetical protein